MRILILGGYGVFGGRLAELLANVAEAELLICGRDLGKAEAFCKTYNGLASAHPIRLDRKDIAAALTDHKPDLVVDASGPFQDYGAQQYHVVRACITAKVNYLDFADAADFVFGITEFDGAAKAAGIYVLSGVSSFPVLTAAVLREIAKTMDIRSVHGGIAPSPYAGIGLNVMRAVVGYAGAPVKLLRNGQQSTGTGLAESMRYTIAVPGKLPLRNIHFSLVDVPDLQVIPPQYPAMTDIWMGAGPVPEILHRALNLLAKLRAIFKLPSLAPFSRLFYIVLNAMRFGEHRGGMFVTASGKVNGANATKSWHLLAEGDDGPYIPSMAIEGIIRKQLGGQTPSTGARPATNALELSDYQQLFQQRKISSGFRDSGETLPLYHHILGPAFSALPEMVQALHRESRTRQWAGTADIGRGRGPFAWLCAALFGFPKAGLQVPVTVTFAPENGGELWTRDFDGKCFSSHQSLGVGKDEHLLVERFGIAAFSLALVIKENRLHLVPRRWKLLGIPMPRFFLPHGDTFETQINGRFCFDVEIRMPLLGLIVSYKGNLEPVESA